MTPVEAYKLRMALVNAGYIPVPCLPDGKPIFIPSEIPSEPAVRSWATLHERATKTGILDPITKHVTLVVQSRSEVGWIASEAVWLICPRLTDRFVGR